MASVSRIGFICSLAASAAAAVASSVVDGITWAYSSAGALLLEAVDSIFYVVRWAFQPAPRDLALLDHARTMRDDADDARRAAPFLAFIKRALGHPRHFGGGLYSECRHSSFAAC